MTPVSALLESEICKCGGKRFRNSHQDIDVLRDERFVGRPEVDRHPAHDDRMDSERRPGRVDHRDHFERALGEVFDPRRIGERGSQFGEIRIDVLAHATNLPCDPADSEIASPAIVAMGFGLRPVGGTSRESLTAALAGIELGEVVSAPGAGRLPVP